MDSKEFENQVEKNAEIKGGLSSRKPQETTSDLNDKNYEKVQHDTDEAFGAWKQRKRKQSIIANAFGIVINAVIITLYILAMLIKCKHDDEECQAYWTQKRFNTMFFEVSIAGILTGLLFFLTAIRVLKIYVGLVPFLLYIVCIIIDHKRLVTGHGLVDLILAFAYCLIIFCLLMLFYFFVIGIKRKEWIKTIISSVLFLGIIVTSITLYILYAGCKSFYDGLAGFKFNNDKNDNGCTFIYPDHCYSKLLTTLFSFDFEKETKSYEEIVKDAIKGNDYLTLGTQVIGIPLTTNFVENEEYKNADLKTKSQRLQSYVIQNIRDYDVIAKDPAYAGKLPEVTFRINSPNKNKGNTCIKVQRNEEIVKKAKEKIQKSQKDPKYKNLLVFYFDSLSRMEFQRKMSKTARFIRRYLTKEDTRLINTTERTFKSYEFLKYHIVDFDQENQAESIFYDYVKNKDTLEYFKENGFITGQTINKCTKRLYNNKNSNSTSFDHENVGMFCLDRTNLEADMHQVVYKNKSYEYMLEYAEQFWAAYKGERKYFRASFYDTHFESLSDGDFDTYLKEFLKKLKKRGAFQDTMIMFISGNGQGKFLNYTHVKGFGSNQFDIEQMIGCFYIMAQRASLHLSKSDRYFLDENQQKMISAYDISHTITELVTPATVTETEQDPKYKTGDNLFGVINGQTRACESWTDLNSDNCKCKLVSDNIRIDVYKPGSEVRQKK